MSRHRFAGMNPVRQRPIGVDPSQGGFFSVPADERNFGQQNSLPYDQQLNMNHKSNFAHSNASGCGYSNFTRVGRGGNVLGGAGDRDSGTFKCKCPSGGTVTCINNRAGGCETCIRWGCDHEGYPHRQRATATYSKNFSGGRNQDAIWSGAQTNVGPSDRIFAGNYATGRASIRPMGGVQPANPGERDQGGNCVCSCANGGGCVEHCDYSCEMCNGAMNCRCCEGMGGPLPGARVPGGVKPYQKRLRTRRGR